MATSIKEGAESSRVGGEHESRREALADAEKAEKVAQRTATRASRSKQDPPAIVDGQPPKDWNKGRRVIHDFGGTQDLPGRFVNPSSETLWPTSFPPSIGFSPKVRTSSGFRRQD